MRRLITAAVLAPFIVAAIFGLPNAAFAWLVVLVFAGCAWEYAGVNRLGARPWIYALALAAILATSQGLLRTTVADGMWLLAAVLLAAVWVVMSRRSIQERASAGTMAGFGVVYFVLAVGALVGLQAIDPWLVLLLVAIVALGDSAAYYAGRALGERKMAAEISPNKTWAGFTGSLLTALLVAAAWALWRGESLTLWLVIGVATNLAAQTGDLLQSAFKRQAGVKDSSDLLPGHGGVWDRTDAILLAAPVFAALLTWLEP